MGGCEKAHLLAPFMRACNQRSQNFTVFLDCRDHVLHFTFESCAVVRNAGRPRLGATSSWIGFCAASRGKGTCYKVAAHRALGRKRDVRKETRAGNFQVPLLFLAEGNTGTHFVDGARTLCPGSGRCSIPGHEPFTMSTSLRQTPLPHRRGPANLCGRSGFEGRHHVEVAVCGSGIWTLPVCALHQGLCDFALYPREVDVEASLKEVAAAGCDQVHFGVTG